MLLVHIRHPARRWFTFQNMGPSPSGRSGHAMASDGTRVFVLGGESSVGAQADETQPIYENTEHIMFPKSGPEESRVSLWNVCGLRKPKLRSYVGTKKALG